MRNTAITRTLAAILLSAVLIGMTGCGDKQLVKQIDSFQKSVDKTTTAVAIYYTELNNFQRELYMDYRLYNPNLEVFTEDATGKPTALAGETFSPEGIKARTDAIAMLGRYGEELTKLAGNDAPERFAAGTVTLGENIAGLATTFGGLTDSTSKNYKEPLGALGTIVGQVGRLVLEAKRDEALRKAIKEAAPKVNNIIDLLEKDLNEVIKPLRKIDTLHQREARIKHYNNNKGSMDFATRREALNEIIRMQKTYEIAVAFNPSGILGSLKKAHNSLIEYAESGRKAMNLAKLISDLEEFHERADTILKAVVTLKSLKGGLNA